MDAKQFLTGSRARRLWLPVLLTLVLRVSTLPLQPLGLATEGAAPGGAWRVSSTTAARRLCPLGRHRPPCLVPHSPGPPGLPVLVGPAHTQDTHRAPRGSDPKSGHAHPRSCTSMADTSTWVQTSHLSPNTMLSALSTLRLEGHMPHPAVSTAGPLLAHPSQKEQCRLQMA